MCTPRNTDAIVYGTILENYPNKTLQKRGEELFSLCERECIRTKLWEMSVDHLHAVNRTNEPLSLVMPPRRGA